MKLFDRIILHLKKEDQKYSIVSSQGIVGSISIEDGISFLN